MVRLELLDFLLEKHPLHIRKSLDDALFDPCRILCNETRLLAVGSHKIHLIFILLMSNINYFYVDSQTYLASCLEASHYSLL